jgi:hypothetical protein
VEVKEEYILDDDMSEHKPAWDDGVTYVLEEVKVEESEDLASADDEGFARARGRRRKTTGGVKKPKQVNAPVDPFDGQSIFHIFTLSSVSNPPILR